MAAATMYVTVAGAGDNSGDSWANAMDFAAWLSDMKNNAEAGDVYYVMSGTYTSTADWLTAKAGTNLASITVIGVSDEALTPATLANAPFISNGAYYFIFDGGYWKWSNVSIYGTTASYGCIRVTGNACFANCQFTNDSGTAGRSAYLANGNWTAFIYACYAKCDNGFAFNCAGYSQLRACHAADSTTGFRIGFSGGVHYSIANGCVTGVAIASTHTALASIVAKNTIYDNTTGISLAGCYLCDVRSNLIDTNTTGITNTSAFTSIDIDYNNYNGNGTDVTNVTKGPNATASVPQFVNAAAGDFTLTAGSPCLTQGMPITLGVAASVTTHQGAVPPVEGAGGGGGGPLVGPSALISA